MAQMAKLPMVTTISASDRFTIMLGCATEIKRLFQPSENGCLKVVGRSADLSLGGQSKAATSGHLKTGHLGVLRRIW